MESCRHIDVQRLDAHSLSLVFMGPEPRTNTAMSRIMERAYGAWQRVGRPDPLQNWVTVEEIRVSAGQMVVPDSARRVVAHRAAAQRVSGSLVKRAIDIVGAVIAGILATPLMVLIACGIRVTSEGPVLFLQRRVGQNGQLFTMFKFRTMRHQADEQSHRHHMKALMTGAIRVGKDRPTAKLSDDPRIYPLGSLLRRWSLDELPQLYNVLNGTMSLVGPRPSVHYELEDYEDWHRERLAVKPGITGLMAGARTRSNGL